ncbi:carbohydrate ABC transporter substrate-binding protein [Candidatus Gracilibacteria bacterium]|nr:carbohydrate ABC transporter substrate-binding protein [Candidatus Gracilibacteria bacterium]
MSRNKTILFIIGGIILFFAVVIILIMLFSNNSKKGNSSKDVFSIRMVGDSAEEAQDFVDGFKRFANTNMDVNISSFNSYDEYTYALTYAIANGETPDIFVLNSNEKNSLFENQTVGIPPDYLNPSTIRKEYKDFVSNQLISQSDTGTEFLLGLPIGYETLGVFFNKRFVKRTDLENISSLKSAVAKLKEKSPENIPIAIGNGTTLDSSEDIATQFMMSQSGDKNIESLQRRSVQAGLGDYLYFGDIEGDNKYNSRLEEMKVANQNAVDLFSEGETYMVAGYPRLINKISKKGFSSNYLEAVPFPLGGASSGAALVNYNYFVVNKDSAKGDLAGKFMSYVSSADGIKIFLKAYPYYLPAAIAFEKEAESQMIHKNYKIAVTDFYSEKYSYTSFNKGIKTVYDAQLRVILDSEKTAVDEFTRFQKSLNCKTEKAVSQKEFSKVCD